MIAIVIRLVGAVLVLAFVAYAAQIGRVPQNLLWIYLVLGALSFANYWRDKRAAEAGRDRVSERSLLLLDLVFGIAGGLAAQALLRHKLSKPQYGMLTGVITALHLAALALLILGLVRYPS